MSDDKDNSPPHLNIPHPVDDDSITQDVQYFSTLVDQGDTVAMEMENTMQRGGASESDSDNILDTNVTTEQKNVGNISSANSGEDTIVPERYVYTPAEDTASSYNDIFKTTGVLSKIQGKMSQRKNFKSNALVEKTIDLYTKIRNFLHIKSKKNKGSIASELEMKAENQASIFLKNIYKGVQSVVRIVWYWMQCGVYTFKTASNSISRKSGVILACIGFLFVLVLHASMNIPKGVLPLIPVSSVGTSDAVASSLVPVQSDNQFENSIFSTTYRVHATVKKGQALGSILNRMGIANDRRLNAMFRTMRKKFNPRNVYVGQKIIVDIVGGYSKYIPAHIDTMELSLNAEKSVIVSWNKNKQKYSVSIRSYPLKPITKNASGVIKASLYNAMEKQGVKRGAIVDFLNLFSFDVDFQRDIRKNDSFDIVYNEYSNENGAFVRSGDITVAELSVQGHRRRYYKYKNKNGKVGFYDYQGKSGRKALMKTPIEGARLSSSFGNRRHPVLGYTKLHNGTDFAAPKGTPIFAAGDGVVEYAGRKGPNGIYVRIRHNSTYKTSYAHMSGIARGVRRGKRVTQGKIIGYVGSTGRSTGNHLHYSVFKNGKAINSRLMKLPSGGKLTGKTLADFKKKIAPFMKDGQ